MEEEGKGAAELFQQEVVGDEVQPNPKRTQADEVHQAREVKDDAGGIDRDKRQEENERGEVHPVHHVVDELAAGARVREVCSPTSKAVKAEVS